MAPWSKEDSIYKRMRLVICSTNRSNLILSLHTGKNLLARCVRNSATMPRLFIHALRELERDQLVRQDVRRDYYLTAIGRALVQKVIDCRCMAEALTLCEAFWVDHDVSGLRLQ